MSDLTWSVQIRLLVIVNVNLAEPQLTEEPKREPTPRSVADVVADEISSKPGICVLHQHRGR